MGQIYTKGMVYRWGSYSELPLMLAMKELGIEVVPFEKKMKDYHIDAEFAQEFLVALHKENVEFVFSFDYFPLVASLCATNQIPYYSWIYDCPMLLLNSQTISLSTNRIFCFDRIYAMQLQQRGAVHCYHFPLAASESYFAEVIKDAKPEERVSFQCDVSFVGNFYNGEKNRVRNAKFSARTKGYLDGLLAAQKQICGYNFIKESLLEEVVDEVAEVCELQLGNFYDYEKRQLVADAVGMELSAIEREEVMQAVSEVARVHLYTGSELPACLMNSDNIINRGYADNKLEMPLIFHESKINFNITSRTIISGIPQRVLDILVCGGFCLTNYQPEIEEYFKDGVELVMYAGKEDAMEKVKYYLAHDEEREEIAKRGYDKVVTLFRLEKRLQEMLEIGIKL